MQHDSHALLGQFIRAHREQMPTPAQSSGRRRTPGLRREELAMAAGVSTTWVTWLEQGRNVSASVVSLARLAQALDLSEAERATLFELAGKRDPYLKPPSKRPIDAALQTLVSQFEQPCYLLDEVWNACCWNNSAEQLMVGWLDSPQHNLLHYTFLEPQARELIVDWPQRAQRMVAEFRADFSRYPDNPEALALIDELCEKSPSFAQLWQQQSVLSRDGGERAFLHPTRGLCYYQQTTLHPAGQSELKLVFLTAQPS